VRELIHLSAHDEFSHFFKLQPGAVSSDLSAIVGRGGFLFVNDGSNKWKDQLSGELVFDAKTSEQTSNLLQQYHDLLSSHNIIFRFVIVPEKDVVYSDLSPNVVSALATKRPAQELAARHSAFTLYSKDALSSATTEINTYHARNSHFNFFGGMVVAEQILSSLDLKLPSAEQIPSDLVFWPDDLSVKWVPDLKTRRRILRRFYKEEEVVKVESHVGRYLVLRNDNAPKKLPIMIFGDSYSWNPDAGVARYLSLVFTEVHFLWKKQIDWELVERVKPAALILQSAERFLIRGLS
jgi:hypothetical protein